jgi:hypothetical protein
MEPALADGQGLVAIRSGRAAVGQLRCVEHPGRSGFWLVKRVDELHGDGTMSVRSDNRSIATVDSGSFGPVPVEGTYRVIVRVPRRWM